MSEGSIPTADRLGQLFAPRSVALVGATDRSQWSVYTDANLRQYSPGVAVHLVSPRGGEVHGRAAHRAIGDIGEPVDLAYVMVPTAAALEVTEQIADAGVRNVVMLTAGFAEAGPAGERLQADLLSLAAERDLVVLGPNGNGFINVAGSVTPYGLPIAPPLHPGPVGVVLQSGGLASIVLAAAQATGVGLSFLAATGNEAMVSATDVIRYLIADEATRVVAAFLESVRQPEELAEVAAAALDAGKPIVALKAGRSEAGSRAALAHTGAVAGDDRIVDAAFRQLGIIRVDSLEELLATAGHLGYHGPVPGRRLAAVTPSGGACDILADVAAEEGLELPEYPDATLGALAELLPAFSNPHNPLDVTGYVVVDPSLSLKALEVVGAEAAGHYDAVLYNATIPRVAPAEPAALEARFDALADAARTFPVPLLLLGTMAADLTPYSRELLAERGLYVLNGIELGLRAIGHGARYRERRGTRAAGPSVPTRPGRRPPGGTGIWPEHLAREVLGSAGVPLVPAVLATSASDAAEAAASFGQPVAMKVASPDVVHKTDMGGVRLDVDVADAGRTFTELQRTFSGHVPDARFDGVLVSPMRRGGTELVVGVTRAPGWGPVLSVGLGGVWVEVLDDVALRLLPVDASEVGRMLAGLRGAPLLRGARGAPPADIEGLTRAILAVAEVALGLGDALDTLEVNPLRVDGRAVEALDALIVWSPQQ